MKIVLVTVLATIIHSGSGSLMSRIGLTLGKKPAHLNQLDHTRQHIAIFNVTSVCASRRVPWAVKEMIEEEKRKDDELPFIKKKHEKREGPPPCVGICYTKKLEALKAREELTKHNEVLKEECESDDCIDYKAFGDSIPVQFTSKPEAKQTVPPHNSEDSNQHDDSENMLEDNNSPNDDMSSNNQADNIIDNNYINQADNRIDDDNNNRSENMIDIQAENQDNSEENNVSENPINNINHSQHNSKDDGHQEETTNNESMITAATAATAASDDKEAADKDDKSKNSESNNKPTSYVTERSNILNDIIINNNI